MTKETRKKLLAIVDDALDSGDEKTYQWLADFFQQQADMALKLEWMLSDLENKE